MENDSFRKEDGWMTAEEAGIDAPGAMVFDGRENIREVRMRVDPGYRAEQIDLAERAAGVPFYKRERYTEPMMIGAAIAVAAAAIIESLR